MADDFSRDPVLVFDGESAFCSSVVRWLERYPRASLSSGGWEAVPSQLTDPVALGGRRDALLWVTPARQVHTGSQAVARLLLRSGGAWAYAGALLTLPPIRPLAEAVYGWLARRRDRLPG